MARTLLTRTAFAPRQRSERRKQLQKTGYADNPIDDSIEIPKPLPKLNLFL
jgi:hypothetical protein